MPGFDTMATTCKEGERGAPTPLGETFRAFHGCHQLWLRSRGVHAQAKIRELRGRIRHIEWNTHRERRPAARETIQELSTELERWMHYRAALARLHDRNEYVVQVLRIKIKERPHLLSKGFFASRGQVLQVLEQNRSWYKVRTKDGRVGYVHKGDLVLGKPIELNSMPGRKGGSPSLQETGGGRG